MVSGGALVPSAQLCFGLYAAERAMTACYRPLLAPLGLTHTQYLVMLALWEQPVVTVGDLGQRLQLDSGTISPVLGRLARARLIRRRRSPDDERVVEITTTGRGQELRAEAEPVPRQVAGATGMTPEEIADLRDTLEVLTMRLRAAELRPEPVRSAAVAGFPTAPELDPAPLGDGWDPSRSSRE